MRTFYIFSINNEFYSLTKTCPFNLYKTLEQIYYLNKNDVGLAYQLFESVAYPFNKKKINNILFNQFQKNDHYTKFNNMHMINNYYTDEQTELIVKNAHIIIKSSISNPVFLDGLKELNNLFICDFKNKDYFWLDQIHVH